MTMNCPEGPRASWKKVPGRIWKNFIGIRQAKKKTILSSPFIEISLTRIRGESLQQKS